LGRQGGIVPLITENIDEARRAYAALEARAAAAEQRAEALSAALQASHAPALAVGGVVAGGIEVTVDPAVLRQHIVNVEAQKVDLQTKLEAVQQQKVDTTFQTFVQAVALAAAIAEAAMPERAIPIVSGTLQSFLSPTDAGVGIRFIPPELAGPAPPPEEPPEDLTMLWRAFATPPRQLSSTSFEMTKVTAPAGTPTLPNLYTVLQETEQVFTHPFWSRFPAAAQVVAETAKALANSGGWSFAYLVSQGAAISAQEKNVASAIGNAAPADKVSAFNAAVDRLQQLLGGLTPAAKPIPVVGDLYALTAAIAATTGAAKACLP
jgi:hypothetical protein